MLAENRNSANQWKCGRSGTLPPEGRHRVTVKQSRRIERNERDSFFPLPKISILF